MSYEKNLVSIVIPVYNASKYISECIKSVGNQSYQNIEIIFVNDGSTDDSVSEIEKYQQIDNRIILINLEHRNSGWARNNGIKYANGKYIAFWDVDDRYDRFCIERMVERAEITEADIVVCKSEGFDNASEEPYLMGGALNENLVPDKMSFSGKDIPNYIFQITAGWPWDKLYRLSFVRLNKLEFLNTQVVQDAYFTYIAYAVAERITIASGVYVYHRMYNNVSAEGSRAKNYNCVFVMLCSLKKELQRRNLFERFEISFINVASEHIAFFAEAIHDSDLFSNFIADYKETAQDLIRLKDYSDELFYNKLARFIVLELENSSLPAILCHMLVKIVIEKNKYMQKLEWIVDKQNQTIEDYKLNKKWWFDKEGLGLNQQIIVYGYGDVGKDYCRQIEDDSKLTLVMVVDQDYENYKDSPIKVGSVDDLKNTEYDIIIIAVYSKETAESIRENLIDLGVESRKIIWKDPKHIL